MIKMRKVYGLIIFCLGFSSMTLIYAQSSAEVDWGLKAPRALEDESVSREGVSPGGAHKQNEILRPEIEYKGEGLKDPFLPLVAEKKNEITPVPQEQEVVKPLPVLTVQGLIWGGLFPQAIINNKVVRPGDMLEEVMIKDIDKEGVTVLFANMEHRLSPSAATGPRPKKPIGQIN